MTNSDPFAYIATREAKAERMRRELEMFEAETRGMKMLADATLTPSRGAFVLPSGPRPAADEKPPIKPVAPKPGGRPAGAISHVWRAVLAHLYDAYEKPGNGFSPDNLVNCAAAYGMAGLRVKDAKDRIAVYKKHGYIEDGARNDYYVTDYAIQRFKAWGPIQTNKAPNAEASEPHEIARQGDQTGTV